MDASTREGSLRTLATAIARHAPAVGDHPTPIPGMTLHRRHTRTERVRCIYRLGLTVVAQGGKQVLLGPQVVDYRPGQCMLTTIEQPVVSHVTHASAAEPFLAVMLCFDMQSLLQAASDMAPPVPGGPEKVPSVTVEPLEPRLADAVTRLVLLLDEPHLLPRLQPLIRQEIVVRLMDGRHARQIQQWLLAGAPAWHIANAMAWLKENFTRSVSVQELATRAHMSESTFREQFRTVTGMSPLQFQKQLRLQEARQLMLNRRLDASRAATLVGYESPSQFSREYSRLFGSPPQRDVRSLRQAGFSAN